MSVAPHYTRSEIYSYYDLSEGQQSEVINNYYNTAADADNDSFVIFKDSPLPLSMFMRTDYRQNFDAKKPYWDGIYGTSYFSAYFIKLSRCGTMAVVAERFC